MTPTGPEPLCTAEGVAVLDNRDTLVLILALLLTAGCSASGGPEQPLPDALWPAAIVAAMEPMAAQQARTTRVDPNPAALPSARRLPVADTTIRGSPARPALRSTRV